MNDLKTMIQILSEEEKKAFINHLKQKNKRKDVKNISLFKLLDTHDRQKPGTSLYNQSSKQAYHALRKRLYDRLIDFIGNKDFENQDSEDKKILKLIWASRALLEKNQILIAFKTLQKAEDYAVKIDAFGLLNEIYQIQIQYAHLNSKISLKALTNTFQKNLDKLKRESQLNLGYAYLRNELNDIQKSGKIADFQLIIDKTIESFDISFKDVLTYRSLYQIMFITNEYAHLNRNYHSIEAFMQKSYEKVISKESQRDTDLFYHIQILYFMSNLYFRNKKFNQVKVYLSKMHSLMQLKRKRYYNRFLFKYTLLYSLNENYLGNCEKAIQVTENALHSKYPNNLSETNTLYLSLAAFYFQNSEFKKTLNVFKKFNHTDSWYEKKLGIDWNMKKNLVEILLHIELENIDYAASRIISFTRRYFNYLKQKNEVYISEFVKLIEYYLNNPDKTKTDRFKNMVKNVLENRFSNQQDIFILSFYAWLKAKISGKSITQSIEELIKLKH